MPLEKGSSDEVVSRNISREEHSGTLTAKTPEMKHKQAIAIAMRKAGRMFKRKKSK